MHKKQLIQTCCVAMLAITPLGLPHANPVGSVQTANGTFTFSPAVCGIHKEGDIDDIEVYGPGVSPSGEKVFVVFSSTAQALEVNFGVDSVFASADLRLISQGELQVHVEGGKVRVEAIRLIDQDRQVVDTDVTLEVECS